jgi:hypothetical protein
VFAAIALKAQRKSIYDDRIIPPYPIAINAKKWKEVAKTSKNTTINQATRRRNCGTGEVLPDNTTIIKLFEFITSL